MISVRRTSSSVSAARFAQQLRRMAHGADRVANFVRDTRAQAPERCELGLLHARIHDARRLRGKSGSARRVARPCPAAPGAR